MINILIVEDNKDKLDKIINLINDEVDISSDNVYKATNIKEAKLILRKNSVDLMILDLVLPLDSDDNAIPDNGINFLDEINSHPTMHPPIHIVGLTEFAEYREHYADKFTKYLWHLVDYKAEESNWKEKLKEIIFHLIKVRKDFLNPINFKYDYDIAILAALNTPELEQVLKLQAKWVEYSVENDATIYHTGYFERENKKLKVVCASAPQMGMVASATLAMKMINRFNPKYIIMTGIAAGYKDDKVDVGDILVADQSYDGTSGKMVTLENGDTAFSPNLTPIPLDADVKEKIRNYENKHELFAKIKKGFNGNKPTSELKIKIGPIVSVPYVIQNEDKFLSFKDNQRKLIGLEMESYGIFYSAYNTINPKPIPIVIKSVCDFGDSKKGDNYQIYAAYTSANFMYEFALNEL
ncbi:MAG: response regulator [Clostridiales bacterium]|jgi:nucleoside phosphorylase|nr:response regulator [Clostridiales bacterium]